MDAERQFRVVFIAQSDGKLEWRNPKTSKTEVNAPPKTKLLNSNKGEMAYEELDFNDKRHKDWRKKLGTLLVQDEVEKRKLSGKDVGDLESTKFVLGDLPENYKLYEGTRHEGTKLRKEIFVYGHPEGPKKRYRAAREFIPHLAWLCNDKELDPRNCECKFCAPADTQKAFEEMTQYQIKKFGIKIVNEKPAKSNQQTTVKPEAQSSGPIRKTSINTSNNPVANVQDQQSLLPVANPTSIAPHTQPLVANKPQLQPQLQKNAKPNTTNQKPTIAPNQKPTPPIPQLDPDQKIDFLPQKFMFRQGETVWFLRDNAQGAYGLGVVTNRQMIAASSGIEKPQYVVQQLCHPFHHPTPVIRDEGFLKPWLAYSPPDAFHETLRSVDIPFHKLPWNDIIAGKWGQGDAEADGSIFAARTVDGSYATFEHLSTNKTEKSYNGVFFGGEKIWRGEAIRLAGASREGQILILSDILEVTPSPAQPPELIFVGDVYNWKRLKVEDKSPPPNNFLPQILNLDLNFRNEAARAARKPTHIWHFVESRARFSWEDVKGRWYPSKFLVPSLCGGEEALREQIQNGEIIDASNMLNGQGDYAPKQDGRRIITKQANRAAAFGNSIPSGNAEFDLTDAHYDSIYHAGAFNTSKTSTLPATNLRQGYMPQQHTTTASQASSMAQMQQHFQSQTPEQQMLMMQHLAQQQQRSMPASDMNSMVVDNGSGSGQDAMDVDFEQFIN